jgi:hypothetical protein
MFVELWSWVLDTSKIVQDDMDASFWGKLLLVGTSYKCVFNFAKFIHEQLTEYPNVRYIWREFVLCCSRKHIFCLGEVFSKNMWLHMALGHMTEDFDFEGLCHTAGTLSCLMICAHRLVDMYTTEHNVLLLLRMTTSGCLFYAWYMQATWQQQLSVYVLDIAVRLAPWSNKLKTSTGRKKNGEPDMRFKCHREGL